MALRPSSRWMKPGFTCDTRCSENGFAIG
jgi:hypothetical protein